MKLCAKLFIEYGPWFSNNTALLRQKEASDIPSKSELLMFSYFTQCALLPGQILYINTHPAKRYVRTKDKTRFVVGKR